MGGWGRRVGPHIYTFVMFGGRQAGDELLMYDERSKRRCEALRKWKPLEGATLGMVYTYFLLFLTVVFMGVGIWHCRANRLSTEVSCTSDSCRILKQIGSAVQLDQDLPRSTIVAASAVRMEDGKVVETKGLKKRQIQRLNYGAVIKFRSEAEDPSHPNRGARSAICCGTACCTIIPNGLDQGRCCLDAERTLCTLQGVQAGGRPATATRRVQESRTLTSRAKCVSSFPCG